jgi:hypothetical protein
MVNRLLLLRVSKIPLHCMPQKQSQAQTCLWYSKDPCQQHAMETIRLAPLCSALGLAWVQAQLVSS